MDTNWRTAWQGQDIVVWRNEVEFDRLHAPLIDLVVLVHRDAGMTPGDLVLAVVDLGEDCIVFPTASGFAGRVNFERQSFWRDKACVFWVAESAAPLPAPLRRSRWWPLGAPLGVTRRPRAELESLREGWPLEGPQTWEQRKWLRIERARPFTAARLPLAA
jgi:hypothetical protein